MNHSVKIIILGILISFKTTAQSNDLAFSKSYLFEYEAQYAKAIKSLQELNHENYEIDLRLGWLFYLSKDYGKSEAFYRKAIALEPASVESRFGLVLPLSAQGNWNAVLNVYAEILKYDPNNSIANYRTASIYFTRKDYSNAANFVLKVIRLYPFDYDSNLLYGKTLMAQGKNSEAKKYVEKALEYNPQSEEAKAIIKKL
jgi:tetratricopeptide (TPR) repeat protein